MYAFALALSLAGQSDAREDFDRRLSTASTAELAAEFLPPAAAKKVVRHQFEGLMPGASGPPYVAITFFGHPMRGPDGFCVRQEYRVWSPKSEPKVLSQTQLRLGDCPASATAIFAAGQPGTPLPAAKRALRWLEWARAVAQTDVALPFQLSCKSETDVDRCAGGARKALAELPLEKTYIVSGKRHFWEFAITETEPGQALWDVEVTTAPDRSRIHLTWKIPAPL